MKEDLVSIIVPVYNVEAFIEETIKSVLNQTYKKWELILVNDKSNDKSADIISENYLQDNIRLINLEKNSGAAIARNVGIEEAKGKYIAFLDADDLWQKEKLEKQIKFAKKNNYDFTFTGYEFMNENGKKTGKIVNVPETLSYKQALKNTVISTSGVILNVEELGKDLIKMPNVRRGQDTATWWKILKTGKIAYGLNEPLHFYRKNKKSLSSNKFIALKRTWNIYRKVEKIPPIKSIYYFIFYIINAIKKRI